MKRHEEIFRFLISKFIEIEYSQYRLRRSGFDRLRSGRNQHPKIDFLLESFAELITSREVKFEVVSTLINLKSNRSLQIKNFFEGRFNHFLRKNRFHYNKFLALIKGHRRMLQKFVHFLENCQSSKFDYEIEKSIEAQIDTLMAKINGLFKKRKCNSIDSCLAVFRKEMKKLS